MTPRIYTPLLQQIYICDPPRIYSPSQNITPSQQLYATLPESTPPSPRIYLTFQQMYSCENIPHFSTNVFVRPSQNLPLPPRIYPQNILEYTPNRIYQNIPPTTICDPPRIHPSLSKYAPFLITTCMCDTPKIYPSLPEYCSILGAIGRFSHIYM